MLVALAWPTHIAHKNSTAWFADHSEAGWATCPITQSGLVRILSAPSFSQDCLTVVSALDVLAQMLDNAHHRFWSDDKSLSQAIKLCGFVPEGFRQITDVYLLALAKGNGGVLVTLDQMIGRMAKGKGLITIHA